MYSLSVPKENRNDKATDAGEQTRRLMDSYGNDVLRTAYMILKDRHRAEDAFQEVFIKVFKKYGSFKGDSSEKTWLISITINVCRDMLRSSWLKRVFPTDRIASQRGGSDVEDRFIRKDEGKKLFESVMSLPEAFRETVVLYYYNGCDTAEIGRLLGTREGTVRSRLHRARELLKVKLEGGMESDE
ncbi:MAG TPA: sigma-70 family RNA polymerase sigma factor [Clostridia bacterium]|nr:sigma-70 family RNA polymerase sigma factor [Clostridia bacterium]